KLTAVREAGADQAAQAAPDRRVGKASGRRDALDGADDVFVRLDAGKNGRLPIAPGRGRQGTRLKQGEIGFHVRCGFDPSVGEAPGRDGGWTGDAGLCGQNVPTAAAA